MPATQVTLTALERVHLGLVTAIIGPWNAILAALLKPFSEYGRSKSLGRVALGGFINGISPYLSIKQLRVMNGTTEGKYTEFVKQAGLEETIEDLGIGGARLLWIGPRRLDKVIFYLHGGGYVLSVACPEYWRAIQVELEKKGLNVGIAMLRYTLLPDEQFPYLLNEAVTAIHHLQKSGVDPSNIILVGESAGGSFVHALLSHYLHPYPDSSLVPKLTLTDNKPFAGAFLLSPWSKIGLTVGVPKGMFPVGHIEGYDILSGASENNLASTALKGIPPASIPYVDSVLATTTEPEGRDWYQGLEGATRRVLISLGTVEIIRDAIRKQYEAMSRHHHDVELYSHELGIHADPHMDVTLGQLKITELTERVVEWLQETFDGAQ